MSWVDESSSMAHDPYNIETSPNNPPLEGEYLPVSTQATAQRPLPQTQTQTQIDIQPIISIISTVRYQISTRILAKGPPRPHTEMAAAMDKQNKSKKQKDGEAIPESRTLLQHYKDVIANEKKKPNSCPGANGCKRFACGHLQDPRANEVRRKIDIVKKKSETAGYPITIVFAKKWLDKYPDDINLAVTAAKYDIDAREAYFMEEGRFSFTREKAVALQALGHAERDAILDFMEKEERLFRDFVENDWESVWGLRCKHAIDEARGLEWYETCKQEVKYRASRQKHFKTLREKVQNGEVTQHHMDTCLERIDAGYAKKQQHRTTQLHENRTKPATGDGKDMQNAETAVGSLVSSSTGGKETESKSVAAPTIQSEFPIRTAMPTEDKDVGKAKQDDVEDEIDPEMMTPLELRVLSDTSFKAIYGRPLPCLTPFDLLKRFIKSMAMHEPRVHEVAEMASIVDGGERYRQLFLEVFEERVTKAEWYMANTCRADFDISETMAMINIKEEILEQFLQGKMAEELVKDQIAKQQNSKDQIVNNQIAKDRIAEQIAKDQIVKDQIEEQIAEQIAKQQSAKDQIAEQVVKDQDVKETAPLTKADKKAEKKAEKKKQKKKRKEERAQEAAVKVEPDAQLEEASVPSPGVPTASRAPRVEQSLFKTMAKAKVESKRKEDGTLSEEVKSVEKLARDLQTSGCAAASVKTYRATQNDKSTKGRNGAQKNNAPKDNIQYRIKLREKNEKMEWPPIAANFAARGFDTFLAYHGKASTALLHKLFPLQSNVVGGLFMIEDGPGNAEDIAHIKELTMITNNRVAELFLGIGANSAPLAVSLYGKFEIEVNHYFARQSIDPCPADIENEALRFALWMYMARGLDDDTEDKAEIKKAKEQKAKEQKEEPNADGDKSGDESEGLYDA